MQLFSVWNGCRRGMAVFMKVGSRFFQIKVFQDCNYSQGSVKCMRAWQAFKYGKPEELQLTTSAQLPIISSPLDILVKVHAASVNPIDVMMLQGYGASVIGAMKKVYNCSSTTLEFPLILGRDFSGTVVDVGRGVQNIKCGDEVWGAIGPQRSGTHSDFIIAHAYSVAKKPKSCSHTESSALPYAALTAWSALCVFGQLKKETTKGIRALVIGASGGVGTFAVQLLKAWGAQVTATCSTDAVEMVQNLGADYVIDYKLQDMHVELREINGFDFILDNVGGNTSEFAMNLLKTWRNSKYITVVSPLLQNTDQYGIVIGTLLATSQAVSDSLKNLKDGRSFRWAFFVPNGCALQKISNMVDNKEIVPVVEKVYEFEDIPEAYKKVMDGHARGKTVINITEK